MEREKKANKKMNVLKEDRQASGLLVGKVSTPAEALAYPLTSVPLALADPDKSLKSQNIKSALQNKLISLAGAAHLTFETNSPINWFVDCMSALNALEPKPTWKDFADAVLSYCTPNDTLNVRRLSIIFDSYEQSYIKQMMQRKRGYSDNRVFITSLKQKMPQGKSFDAFLSNSEH